MFIAKGRTLGKFASVAVLIGLFLIQGSAAFGGLGIERVSTDSSGNQMMTGQWAEFPSISPEGDHVAFHSDADDLVALDENNWSDVFLKDTQTGATTRISVDSAGNESDGPSGDPSVSSGGRYIAYSSLATNLVAGDTNVQSDIFVTDTLTGETTRVSTDSAGNQSTGVIGQMTGKPRISSDGRYVAFHSYATGLVPGDTAGFYDIFVKDTQTGVTTRISTDVNGAQASDGDSTNPSISSDGRYVAFLSYASDLVSEDTNNRADIFVKDTQTGAITRVSTDSSGLQTGGESMFPDGAKENSSISDDGRYVAFRSEATTLVPGDTNGEIDVFMKDTQTGVTTRVSTDSDGNQSTGGDSYYPSLSSDGRYLAFASAATNLVQGDSNIAADVFVKDTLTGSISRVSTDVSGNQSNGGSQAPSISSDGRYLAFHSDATNLVYSDTNNRRDVFRALASTLWSEADQINVSMNMLQESQSLTFAIHAGSSPDAGGVTDTGLDFGDIVGGVSKTGSQTLDVTTNAAEGYSVTASESNPPTTSVGDILPDTLGDSGSVNQSLEGGWTNSTAYGWGFTLANVIGVDATFTNATGYRQFANESIGETPQVVMSSGGPVVGSQVAVWYKVNPSPTQQSGVYSNTITYTVTGNF